MLLLGVVDTDQTLPGVSSVTLIGGIQCLAQGVGAGTDLHVGDIAVPVLPEWVSSSPLPGEPTGPRWPPGHGLLNLLDQSEGGGHLLVVEVTVHGAARNDARDDATMASSVSARSMVSVPPVGGNLAPATVELVTVLLLLGDGDVCDSVSGV